VIIKNNLDTKFLSMGFYEKIGYVIGELIAVPLFLLAAALLISFCYTSLKRLVTRKIYFMSNFSVWCAMFILAFIFLIAPLCG
jgi:hypothetical protein